MICRLIWIHNFLEYSNKLFDVTHVIILMIHLSTQFFLRWTSQIFLWLLKTRVIFCKYTGYTDQHYSLTWQAIDYLFIKNLYNDDVISILNYFKTKSGSLFQIYFVWELRPYIIISIWSKLQIVNVYLILPLKLLHKNYYICLLFVSG